MLFKLDISSNEKAGHHEREWKSTTASAALVLLLACALLCTRQARAQVGCPSPGTCTNPVPATNISGTWTASGESWNVTSTSTSVSGSVIVQSPAPGCPAVTYTVTGSISPSTQVDYTQGSTGMSWTASNPNPSGSCGGYTPVSWMQYTGTIQNDGNDLATGTWSREGGSGSFTLTKSPRDIPTSESTRAVGFSSGLLATVGQFRQTLNATSGQTDIFKGRQVSEATGSGTNYDNCWFPGSTVPKWTGVQGSSWNVGYYGVNPPYIYTDNEWVDDYIGWNTSQVNYYRVHLRPESFPCGARVPQNMYIAISGTSGSKSLYRTLTVGSDIYLDHVVTYRGEVSQSTNY